MKENKKSVTNFIGNITSKDDLYVIRDDKGDVKEKSEELLDLDSIEMITEELYLSSEDLNSINSEELYKINGGYYMSSSFQVEDNIITIYKNVSSMVKRIEELEKLRYTDGLTGLPNYQYFKMKLGQFSKKSEDKFLLAMIDIDNFKAINDNYGHHYGNKVLINFAKILQTTFNKGDLVCKYGGDEFIIAVNKDNMEQLIKRVQILQATAKKSSIRLSISCGISEWNKDILKEKDTTFTPTDIERIKRGEKDQVVFKHNINKADEALYYSKKIAGKDCITIYSPEVREELSKVIDEEKILDDR